MLGILLLILKIIGWVLLGLLCTVLAVLVLALFLPVPYRVRAEFGEKISVCVRVFGIQVFPGKEKADGKKRGLSKRRRKKDADGSEAPEDISPEEEPEKGVTDTPDTEQEQKSQEASDTEQEPSAESPQDKPSGGDPPGRKKGKKPRKKKAKTKKKDKTKKGAKKGMDFDALRAKWELLRAELTDEGNKRAVRHGFSEVAYLLRHCGPRKVKADLAYSLADPANTGYATAALSLCPFAYKKNCDIIPDFASDKLYAKGWVDVRGHVRLLHFACSGVRLLIDKDIRAIIRKIRR